MQGVETKSETGVGAYELRGRDFSDNRGTLVVFDPLPFPAVRKFVIADVPNGVYRGGHAHRTCWQILFPTAGSFQVDVSNCRNARSWELRDNIGLCVPPRHWVSLSCFSPDAICTVLASEGFDEVEVVRDEGEFRALVEAS